MIMPHLIFLTQKAKYKAIAEDVKERMKKDNLFWLVPHAVETSEILSNVFTLKWYYA